MKKIKVISCTGDMYKGRLFECNSNDGCDIGDDVIIPHFTSKPFKIIKIKGDVFTLQNSHVTIECKVIE